MKARSHTLPADKKNKTGESYRRIGFTVDREVLTVHYQPSTCHLGRCPQCAQEVLMLTAEAASVTVGVTRREIYRRIEEGKYHFQESASGDVFLCSVSLDPSGFIQKLPAETAK
jgi:hypothetical protein